MRYINLFKWNIGRYGWIRFDIPAFAHDSGYELIYYLFKLGKFSVIANIRMIHKGDFNKYK